MSSISFPERFIRRTHPLQAINLCEPGSKLGLHHNYLRISGTGSVAVAGKSLQFGGNYNDGGKGHFANVYSNLLEVADGGVISNMSASIPAKLPRQGWDNLAHVNGGLFYSAGGVVMGDNTSDLVATNNVVEIFGGGIFEVATGKDYIIRGGHNALKIIDGVFRGGNISSSASSTFSLVEIGTNGVVEGGNFYVKGTGSKLRYDVPRAGYRRVPVSANLEVSNGAEFEFCGIEHCAPGKYIIAQSTISGYMNVGDDVIAAANAALRAQRPGVSLRKIGNNWTAGQRVQLELKVTSGTMMLVR